MDERWAAITRIHGYSTIRYGQSPAAEMVLVRPRARPAARHDLVSWSSCTAPVVISSCVTSTSGAASPALQSSLGIELHAALEYIHSDLDYKVCGRQGKKEPPKRSAIPSRQDTLLFHLEQLVAILHHVVIGICTFSECSCSKMTDSQTKPWSILLKSSLGHPAIVECFRQLHQ